MLKLLFIQITKSFFFFSWNRKTCLPGGQGMGSGIPIEIATFYWDGLDFES